MLYVTEQQKLTYDRPGVQFGEHVGDKALGRSPVPNLSLSSERERMNTRYFVPLSFSWTLGILSAPASKPMSKYGGLPGEIWKGPQCISFFFIR